MLLQALNIGYRNLAGIKKVIFVTLVGRFSLPPFHYKYLTVLLRIDSKKSVHPNRYFWFTKIVSRCMLKRAEEFDKWQTRQTSFVLFSVFFLLPWNQIIDGPDFLHPEYWSSTVLWKWIIDLNAITLTIISNSITFSYVFAIRWLKCRNLKK